EWQRRLLLQGPRTAITGTMIAMQRITTSGMKGRTVHGISTFKSSIEKTGVFPARHQKNKGSIGAGAISMKRTKGIGTAIVIMTAIETAIEIPAEIHVIEHSS